MASGVAWPIAEVAACTAGGEWDPRDEDQLIFRTLHRHILTSDAAVLDGAVKDADVIWAFLIGFAKRRKSFKKQVLECFNVLMENKAWEASFDSSASLHKAAAELPEDLQAALALQNKVIQTSLNPAALAKLSAVPEEFQQFNVHQSIARFREADKLREGLLQEPDAEATPGGGEASAAGQRLADSGPQRDQLHKGVEMVLSIDGPVKFEDVGVPAFVHLRRGCLHAAHLPEAYEAESTHALAVLDFLVDFTKRHQRVRLKQICEVLNLLLHSSPWAAVLDSSPQLLQRIQKELSLDAQAAFSLQCERIRAAMPEQVLQAVDKGPSASVVQAKKVAESMNCLRGSLFGLVPATSTKDRGPPLAPVQEAAPVPTAAATGSAAPAVNPLLAGLQKVEEAEPAGEKAVEEEKSSKRSAMAEAAGAVKDKLKNMWGGDKKIPADQVPLVPAAGLGAPGPALTHEQLKDGRDYLVDNSRLGSKGEGLTYRRSKNFDDRAVEVARWGTTVRGVDQNDGWLKVGERFLPIVANGTPLLILVEAIQHGFHVGDKVEVFSNSKQAWCPGTVEKVSGEMVTVTYQQPDWREGELTRKELPGTHETLRRPTGASAAAPTPALAPAAAGVGYPAAAGAGNAATALAGRAAAAAQQQGAAAAAGAGAMAAAAQQRGTAVAAAVQQHGAAAATATQQHGAAATAAAAAAGQRAKEVAVPVAAAAMAAAAGSVGGSGGRWSPEESQEYAKAFSACGGGDPGHVVEYLGRSGLPRKALKEIWAVSNPKMAPSLDQEGFFTSCRLVGHCQAMRGDATKSALLESGGEPLRQLLSSPACLGATPPQLMAIG